MAGEKPQYDENGRRIAPKPPVVIDQTGKQVDKRKTSGHERGKKKHRATKDRRAQVEAMAAYGIQEYIIAEIIDVDPKTLRKYYAQELATAKAKATAAVAGKVYQQALKGCTKSQRLFLTTQGGWNPKLDIDQRTLVATIDAVKPDEDYTDPIQASRHYKEMLKNL